MVHGAAEINMREFDPRRFGAFGHWVGQSLAFACIAPEHAVPDAKIEVLMLGHPRPARVLAEAVYDVQNVRPRV